MPWSQIWHPVREPGTVAHGLPTTWRSTTDDRTECCTTDNLTGDLAWQPDQQQTAAKTVGHRQLAPEGHIFAGPVKPIALEVPGTTRCGQSSAIVRGQAGRIGNASYETRLSGSGSQPRPGASGG